MNLVHNLAGSCRGCVQLPSCFIRHGLTLLFFYFVATVSFSQTATDHLQAGREFGAKGDWKQAERELRIYRNRYPDSVTGVVLHAESLIKIAQPFDAALELQKFLQSHPKALRAHELYAVLAADPLQDDILAASELETCVKLSPTDFQAWKSLGDLYLDQEKADEAVQAYLHASRLRPADAVTIASLGHAYDRAGSAVEAGKAFHRASKLVANPKDTASVQYLYGQYLLNRGRSNDSIAAMTKALSFNPRSADAFYWRAKAYDKLNDYKNAERDALQALRLAPRGKEAPLLLINIYRKQGDQENVQKYADIAQKISESEQAQSALGRSLRDALDKAEPLLREGRFAEAASQYEALIQKLPTFYEAYFDLGMCYAQTGRAPEAETAFRKYLSFQPVSADGHAALGILLLQSRRATEATPELEQALQIDPTLDEARKALASEYVSENKPQEAIRVLSSAKSTKDPELVVMLASALSQQGDTTRALREVQRALTLEPGNPDALKLKRDLIANQAVR